MEVDSLGHLCKILHTYEHGLDIVALHEKIKDLLFLALQFLEDYDCETVGTCIQLPFTIYGLIHTFSQGDPQTAFSHLGDVVLFVQYTLTRFKVICIPASDFFS